MKSTDAAIRRLPAPDPSGRQKLYWADDPKGFGILCPRLLRRDLDRVLELRR